MSIKKVKLNSNGKLPTAQDYKNLKVKLSDDDKKRIASTRAALEAMMNDEGYETEKTSLRH